MKIKNLLSIPRAIAEFLRLDASNDPVTGHLHCDDDVSIAPQVEYILHDFCFSFGGIDYDADPMVGFTCSLWWDGVNPNPIMAGTITDPAINGINDIDCGLYWLNIGFIAYLTIFYANGQKAALEAWINGMTGPGNWGCDDFVAPMFHPTGGIYAFTGYPLGWTPAPAYGPGDPVIDSASNYLTRFVTDGRGYIGRDLEIGRDTVVNDPGWLFVDGGRLVFGAGPTTEIINAGGWNWNASGAAPNEYYALFWGGNPQIFDVRYVRFDDVEIGLGAGGPGGLNDHEFGHGDVDGLGFDTIYIRDDTGNPDVTGVVVTASLVQPLLPDTSDNLIQAFQQIRDPVGNACAFILGFQDTSTVPAAGQVWAMNFGISNYGNTNQFWPVYGVQASYRLANNNNWVQMLSLFSTRFTMASAGWPSDRSNVSSLVMYEAQCSREGGDILSSVSNWYAFADLTTFDWTVNNWRGFYANDHFLVAGNSYGLYCLDRAYIQRNLQTLGEIRSDTNFNIAGNPGVSGVFTTPDPFTVTVNNGIITSIV